MTILRRDPKGQFARALFNDGKFLAGWVDLKTDEPAQTTHHPQDCKFYDVDDTGIERAHADIQDQKTSISGPCDVTFTPEEHSALQRIWDREAQWKKEEIHFYRGALYRPNPDGRSNFSESNMVVAL